MASYPKMTIKFSESFHDRFIIRDMEEVIAIGYSFSGMLSRNPKIFFITPIDDYFAVQSILSEFHTAWNNALPF